jgi:hypothetical protein
VSSSPVAVPENSGRRPFESEHPDVFVDEHGKHRLAKKRFIGIELNFIDFS